MNADGAVDDAFDFDIYNKGAGSETGGDCHSIADFILVERCQVFLVCVSEIRFIVVLFSQ